MIIENTTPEPLFEVTLETHRGREAREDYEGFVKTLKGQNISQLYAGLPTNGGDDALVSFVARVDGNVAGVAVGNVRGKVFEGTRLLVHPRFRKSNVSKVLLEAPQAADSGFDEMIVYASPIEGKAMMHDEMMHPVRRKLAERYAKFNLRAAPTVGTGQIMIWKRQNSNN